MMHDLIGNKDKLLKVLYERRRETIAESVEISELVAKTGLARADVQALILDLLEVGYVKTGTPANPSEVATWVRITKSGRDYLREKDLVDF